MTALRLGDLFKGWDFAPRLVAIARGALEAAVLAGLGVVAVNMEEIASFLPEFPIQLGTVEITTASIGYFVIRWLEGEADQIIDPQANRTAERRAANPPQ